MKKPLFLFSVLALLLVASPAHASTEINSYAETIVASNYQFLSETAVLGAPDGLYADTSVNGAYLKLDLGEGHESTSPLTLFYETYSTQSQLQFDFFSVDGTLLSSYGNYVPLNNVWVIDYTQPTPYRYVSITSKASGTIRLDAVQISIPAEEEPLPLEEPEVINADPLAGSLVKLTDDWDDATDADKTIYLLDANNTRHIIPNETVFQSWNLSLNDVTVIGEGTLTGMPLGKNVYIRPSSNLVKIQANPRVYAVGGGGVLHWIQTEELATKLYGANWATRVVDLPETLFVQYKKGDAITEAIFPVGSFIKTDGGNIWYIGEEGKRFSIGPKTLSALDLSEDHLRTTLTEPEIATAHPYEGRLVYEDSQRWPF